MTRADHGMRVLVLCALCTCALCTWALPAPALADIIIVPPEGVVPLPDGECRSVTKRSAAQIGDVRVAVNGNGASVLGLRVLEGELLCLRMAIEAGRVTALQLVDSAPPATDLLRVRLDTHRGRTRLAINTSGERLRFKLGHALDDRAELVVLGDRSAHPGVTLYNSLPGETDELLLFDLRLAPVEPPPPESPHASAWIGVSLGAALYVNQLDALNDAFERQGYTRVSWLQPLGALSFDLVFSRVHLALAFEGVGERTFERVSDGAEYNVSQVIVGFELGYVLYEREGFELFAGLGITAGDVHFDVDPQAPAILPDQLSELEEPELIRRNLYALDIQVGADYRWPVFSRKEGLVFGARLGYAQQLGQESWVREDSLLPDLRGGPSLDVSGPYARLLVGIYGEL